MTEGYWINYSSGKIFSIHEHEQWIRDPKNAKSLGLSPILIKSFGKFKPERDRDKFLLFLMRQAPIMRVRGHGSYITFEFSSSSRQTVMDEILMFCKKNAGPYTTLYINNFTTKETVQMPFIQFEETMDSDGAEGVLRAASRKLPVKSSIEKELVKIAKELLL